MALVETSLKPISSAVKYELPKGMSRKTVTMRVGAETTVKLGTVLGKVFAGTATATAVAGNAGDGTMGTIAVGGTAKAGVYKLTIIEPGTDVGEFIVEDPSGIQVGVGTVGTEFVGGGLTFTLADGANDFASGDAFNITVVKTSEKYKPAVETATDGSAAFAGIFVSTQDGKLEQTFAANTDYPVVVLVRDAMVSAEGMILDSSYNTDAKKQVIYDAMEAAAIVVAETKAIGPLL